ncbi:DUF2326 domain-containing protein [Streptomyces sp. JV186]|uniref:DUF2326 domain-containing protein n=1 Tax=Streptomyces sp. JV186 TaxID=858639 RepID=UPI002E78E556|nr:DUF2326 domain-containing protein [Streptomyces sp. JV186]MEE1723558.1 DUF2326 domain-containing protein [Streptomyces sp. JV186]
MAKLKIRRVFANQPSFREVAFFDGINLVVAERSIGSTERDSRNGVGKSTLIEVIHFCLGSSVTRKNVIYELRETDWAFSLDLEIDHYSVTVTRSFESPSTVTLSGNTDYLAEMMAAKVSLSGEIQVTVKAWKDYLGRLCFGLAEDAASMAKYTPSFRALISYFARSGRDAYLEPFTTSRQVRSWQKQVYNAFLVGLNWRHAAEWQELKDNDKRVKTPSHTSAAQKRQALAKLENERVQLISDQQRLRDQVATFRVVPEYAEVEAQTRVLTDQMRELANESTMVMQVIKRYEEQMRAESPGDLERVEELYREAGLLFSETVTRSLSDVLRFHSDVTRHRREYLHNELTRLRARSTEIQRELDARDRERANLMRTLNAGGAVEDLGALQFKLGRTQERLDEVEKRIEELESVAAEEATVASGRQALLSRALLDRAERRPRWSQVISNFVDVTRYLYGQPGELSFGLSENGFTFETKLQRRGSNGVDLMAIFAYDMSVARVWQSHDSHPGFLLHDSLLFEGVDERQIALALSYAKMHSESEDFQYIAFINSDNIPMTDLDELGIPWQGVIRLTLGDARPEDTLLGFRFGQ